MALAICPKCGAMTQGANHDCPKGGKPQVVAPLLKSPSVTSKVATRNHDPSPTVATRNQRDHSDGNKVVTFVTRAEFDVLVDRIKALESYVDPPSRTPSTLSKRTPKRDRAAEMRRWRAADKAKKVGQGADTVDASPSSPRANGELSS